MSVTRAQKVRLGIFLVVSALLLIGGLVILAGARLGEKRDLYFVRYAEGEVSLNGLDVGSPVKYSGIRVGRVDRISIDPSDVSVIVVTISAKPIWPERRRLTSQNQLRTTPSASKCCPPPCWAGTERLSPA